MNRRLLTVLVAFALCWGIPEIAVRIADPPLQQYRDILFGRDPNSPLLFMRDARLHWTLRPGAEVLFQGRSVRTDPEGVQARAPQAGERALLILGDSTAFGWGVGDGEAFGDRLQARLDAAHAESAAAPAWRVVNAAVPGYSSHQVWLTAQKWIPRLQPALVVLCVGNNEAWPAFRSDRESDARRRISARFISALSRSHFLVWASERLRPAAPEPFIAQAPAGSVVRVSRSEYAENLRAILRLARAAGARVIVLGVPVNLYHRPDRLELDPNAPHWGELQESVGGLIQRGRFDEALARADAAAAAAPESSYPIYLRGILLSLMGQGDAGIELLEAALERNRHPERSKLSYREAAREVAQQEGAAHIDVNTLFREASAPDPRRAVQLYLDWCHPTAEGHRLIADAIFEQIEGSG